MSLESTLLSPLQPRRRFCPRLLMLRTSIKRLEHQRNLEGEGLAPSTLCAGLGPQLALNTHSLEE